MMMVILMIASLSIKTKQRCDVGTFDCGRTRNTEVLNVGGAKEMEKMEGT